MTKNDGTIKCHFPGTCTYREPHIKIYLGLEKYSAVFLNLKWYDEHFMMKEIRKLNIELFECRINWSHINDIFWYIFWKNILLFFKIQKS